MGIYYVLVIFFWYNLLQLWQLFEDIGGSVSGASNAGGFKYKAMYIAVVNHDKISYSNIHRMLSLNYLFAWMI